MTDDSAASPASTRTLPARPSLEHLRNEAKQRLKALRDRDPRTRLADAQRIVAREYGFASWRRLKAHVDGAAAADAVFAAAWAGEVETVRRALEAGFDPARTDGGGRTIHQIAKIAGHEAVELLARTFQERNLRPPAEAGTVDAILAAAEAGDVDGLRGLLDAHPGLIDARGGNFQQQTALHKAAWRNRGPCVRLLLDRGADVRIRDHGDNAHALHFAAEAADLEVVRMLVEAGADVVGGGDDHALGVLGWATCLGHVRTDVADYLLARGAVLDPWSATALGRVEAVRDLLARDPGLLAARMSRSEHQRTLLHHAAAVNRPAVARLLLDLGADPNATDKAGATPVATAAQEGADESIVAMLLQAGARLDFVAAVNLGRYDLAEAMLGQDPSRIGPDGSDTIALHLAVDKRRADVVRWLIDHGVAVDAKRVLWACNHTALHSTAALGAVELARMLLDAGADPGIRDDKYDSTVLGWAEFCGQDAVAALLRERGVEK